MGESCRWLRVVYGRMRKSWERLVDKRKRESWERVIDGRVSELGEIGDRVVQFARGIYGPKILFGSRNSHNFT